MATKVVEEIDYLNNKNLYMSGFFLLIFFLLIIFFLFKNNVINNRYSFKAYFNSVDGVNLDSKVLLAGVEVGNIISISLIDNNKVLVNGVIMRNFNIPSDSILKIDTDGIFGKKYLSIIPGYDDFFTEKNIIFDYTSDSYTLDYLARYLENKINEKN